MSADPREIRMLSSQLRSWKRDLGFALQDSAMEYGSLLTSALREACPYPSLASTIEWAVAFDEQGAFTVIIGTTFYRPQAFWGIEHGRPPRELYDPHGFPLRGVRVPPSGRMSPKALQKWQAERIIIRKRVHLTQIPPKPFIIPTLMRTLNNLMQILRKNIVKAVEGNAS